MTSIHTQRIQKLAGAIGQYADFVAKNSKIEEEDAAQELRIVAWKSSLRYKTSYTTKFETRTP